MMEVADLTAFFTNNMRLSMALWSLAGLIVLWSAGRAVIRRSRGKKAGRD
jgi:hypothetical protein